MYLCLDAHLTQGSYCAVLCFMLPLHSAGNKREVATIYEIVQDADGAAYALPDYQFTCKWTGGASKACVDMCFAGPLTAKGTAGCASTLCFKHHSMAP